MTNGWMRVLNGNSRSKVCWAKGVEQAWIAKKGEDRQRSRVSKQAKLKICHEDKERRSGNSRCGNLQKSSGLVKVQWDSQH